jgi:antitoxin component YwqK of YwqJK toxin-antitoxin module
MIFLRQWAFLSFCLLSTNLATCQNLTDSLGRKQGRWVWESDFDSIMKFPNPINICSFINDTMEGKYSIYEGEKLRFEVGLVGGKKQGIACGYDRKGRVFVIVFFQNDTTKGIVEFYKGTSRVKTIMGADGQFKDGSNITFYKNGVPLIISNFENHKLKGATKEFYRSGKIKIESEWDERSTIPIRQTIYKRNGKPKR